MSCQSLAAEGRDFPGHRAGASLKLASSRSQGRRTWTFPRSLCRGLIEAGCAASCRPRIPRSSCRGLIEAGSPHSSIDFPGHCAGASSKPVISVTTASDIADFPGHCAGASLKRLIGRRIPIAQHDFPGHCAGASLKRVIRLRARSTIRGDFPGRRAGASLKPVRLSAVSSPASLFPRSLCRGLIEASSTARHPVDGARFPRSLCRGLIEAVSEIYMRLPAQPISPVIVPGPH